MIRARGVPAARRVPLALLLALGCARAQEAPAWVRTPPALPGRIYGVAGAALGDSETEALDRAALDARLQVVAFLGSDLRGRLSRSGLLRERQAPGGASFMRETSTLEQTELDVSATGLHGLVVAERCLDRTGHAAYALAYLDCGVATRALAEQVRLLRAECPDRPPGPGLPAALARLRRLRALQARCARLADQADLLQAAGLPPGLRGELRQLADELDRSSAGLQPSLAIGAIAPPGGLGPEVQAILHATAVRMGFAWSGDTPALPLRIEIHAGQGRSRGPLVPYPADPADAGLVGLRAAVRISLLDAAGTVQDGFDLPVRGIGVDPDSALRALEQALRQDLPARFQAFLEQDR